VDLTVFYIFQIISFYYIFIFIDYLSYKNSLRTKKITRAAWVIILVHGAVLVFNLFFGFYFDIDPDNGFTHGPAYVLRLIFAYTPVLLAILDLCVSNKNFKKTQLYLLIFFLVLNGTGAALDIVLSNGALIWPCFSSALLYGYFFIIRTDSKIDSLTGIGNRYSFNEFIDKLSKSNTKQPYSVVMIDVDHFKKINDTLGHLEGDNALRDLAAIIQASVRHTDFAARYGGDEFILAAKAETNIEKLLERIQQGIDAQNAKKVRPYEIHISYGYDTFTPHDGKSIEEFMNHIDSLMYKHKAERRRVTDT
jgi:diguanylate cyclase (GGDEF)-like protein